MDQRESRAASPVNDIESFRHAASKYTFPRSQGTGQKYDLASSEAVSDRPARALRVGRRPTVNCTAGSHHLRAFPVCLEHGGRMVINVKTDYRPSKTQF